MEVAPCKPFSNMVDTAEIMACSFVVDSMVTILEIQEDRPCLNRLVTDYVWVKKLYNWVKNLDSHCKSHIQYCFDGVNDDKI